MTSSPTREQRVAMLRTHIDALLRFYDPIVVDADAGGYNNQLRDDGSVYDAATKHVVGTCRFAVNYALASRIFPERAETYRATALHGLRFLMGEHCDRKHGGFSWVLRAGAVADGTKYCYSVAFSLLALSQAQLSGVPEAEAGQLATVVDLAESKYYEPAHGLYIDSFEPTMTTANPYRGQNANMHMAEALIALHEATGEVRHLSRAAGIARKLTVELAQGCGWVIEHYDASWAADPHKNRDADPSSEEYIFRPPGFQPGHAVEWAKLLVLLERHRRRLDKGGNGTQTDYQWMLPTARALFSSAVTHGWDHDKGGLVYLVEVVEDEQAKEGKGAGDDAREATTTRWRDGNKYYWALAEMIAAAGLLGARMADEPGQEEAAQFYWRWYDDAWTYASAHFVDRERGGWFPMLDRDNERVDPHAAPDHTGPPIKCYPSKTDYHPLSACFEVLRALGDVA